MYRRLSVFLNLLVFTCAAPFNFVPVRIPDRGIAVKELSTNRVHHPVLQFRFSFNNEDSPEVSESDVQKHVGPKPKDIDTVSWGSSSFHSLVVITANRTADENGSQATSDHLPTPPPMPEYVAKLLGDLKAAGVLYKSANDTNLLESGNQKQVWG